MSKEASVIQKYNAKTREYEYFVKGYDITESIKTLLKLHKEAYDKENHSILETKGFIEAQNIYLPKIEELEHRLANCIEPKFKIGQEVWCIKFMKIIKFKINKIEIYRGEAEEENRIVYGNWEDMTYQIEENCFATEAEVKAKLREIQK